MQISKSDEATKQFMVEYFEDIKFEYWEDRLGDIQNKYLKHKSQRKKQYALIDVYSLYVQLLEIFFINILIISAREKYFFGIIFRGTGAKFRRDIKLQFLDEKFQTWFMENLVFGLKEKNEIRDYDGKRQIYISMLIESVNDYLENYNFLNAFKHGFRIASREDKLLNETFGTDSLVIYYTKENNNIYENLACFNFKRIIQKCHFLLSMIDNSKKIFLAQEKKSKGVKLDHLYITDQDTFDEGLGYYNEKKLLFTIEK